MFPFVSLLSILHRTFMFLDKFNPTNDNTIGGIMSEICQGMCVGEVSVKQDWLYIHILIILGKCRVWVHFAILYTFCMLEFFVWLVGWLTDWLVGGWMGWLASWQVGWFDYMYSLCRAVMIWLPVSWKLTWGSSQEWRLELHSPRYSTDGKVPVSQSCLPPWPPDSRPVFLCSGECW